MITVAKQFVEFAPQNCFCKNALTSAHFESAEFVSKLKSAAHKDQVGYLDHAFTSKAPCNCMQVCTHTPTYTRVNSWQTLEFRKDLIQNLKSSEVTVRTFLFFVRA